MLEKSGLEARRSSRRTEERMTASVHSRGDGKYAQLLEGGGDRGAAWRMRWRGQKRSDDADVPPTPGVLEKRLQAIDLMGVDFLGSAQEAARM